MKRNALYMLLVFIVFLMTVNSELPAKTITVNPGDNIESVIATAANGDSILFNAGVYSNVGAITSTVELTILGSPFEKSENDTSKIDDVVIEFQNSVADNWTTRAKIAVRGIKFINGDHQFQLGAEGIISYCIFENGVDQVSFDNDGYGEVSYCRFYTSGDDGIDCDYKGSTSGDYVNVHHNYFERTNQDGIEFRTHNRGSGASLMVYEFHHNTFFKCGTEDGDGGDAIQIIDQRANEDSREILIYNNVIDGDGTTFNAVSCNDNKNSDAQTNPAGADSMLEKIWIYNNTIVGTKYGAINGSNNTYVFNNIVKNSPIGFVHATVKNNLTHEVNTDTADVTDLGSNHYNRDPQMNLTSYELQSGSYCIDKGLLSYTAGGRTITPDKNGDAPDLGAIESGNSASNLDKKAPSLKTSYLKQNFPNPFNPSTRIGYNLANSGQVTLKVYNLIGQEIATLVNDFVKKGEHQVQFNAEKLPSGVYLYTLLAGNYTASNRMMLVR